MFRRKQQLSFPVYSHPVFNLAGYQVYEALEIKRVEQRQQQWSQQDNSVVSKLHDLCDKVESAQAEQQQLLESQLAEMRSTILQAVSGNSDSTTPDDNTSAPDGMPVVSGAADVMSALRLPVFPDKIYNLESFFTGWIQLDKQLFDAHASVVQGVGVQKNGKPTGSALRCCQTIPHLHGHCLVYGSSRRPCV